MAGIKELKTRDEFIKFADVWYQRTHKLRKVWQDENETNERRVKGLKLCAEMYLRVMYLADIAIKINQPKVVRYERGTHGFNE